MNDLSQDRDGVAHQIVEPLTDDQIQNSYMSDGQNDPRDSLQSLRFLTNTSRGQGFDQSHDAISDALGLDRAGPRDQGMDHPHGAGVYGDSGTMGIQQGIRSGAVRNPNWSTSESVFLLQQIERWVIQKP